MATEGDRTYCINHPYTLLTADGCVQCRQEHGIHLTKEQSEDLAKINLATEWDGKVDELAGKVNKWVEPNSILVDKPRRYHSDKTFNTEIATVAQIVADLVIDKQRQYGKDNINDFGLDGVVVRMSDKMNRLKNITRTGWNQADYIYNVETVEDTLYDLAGYALLAFMLLENTFDLPLDR